MAALALVANPASGGAEGGRQPRFLLSWGQKGDRPGDFFSPIGIAISRRDQVFVTDLNNSRVQQFTTAGKWVAVFDLPRDTPERKSSQAGGIAVDDQGLLYITFMMQDCVRVYTAEGKLVRQWGRRGSGEGDLWAPGGIVVARDGTVYVADQRNHRVQRFTREGEFLSGWGTYGGMPGQFGAPDAAGSRFAGPHFLTQDSRGRIYTTEGVAGRIQQFSGDGRFLLSWGSKGNAPGGFGAHPFGNVGQSFGPIGVFADRHDRVWVSSLNDRVQLFTPEGKFVLGLGGSGSGPGQLEQPHGMALDSRDHLYVADAGNQRIQKFEIPAP